MSVEEFRGPQVPPFAPIVETMARQITAGRHLDLELEELLLVECPSDCQDECCGDPREVLDEYDALERFDDYLNETNEVVTVCGFDYDPARVLKEVDPIAYRCSFNDWMDMESESYLFPWNE
jgi:hypothetical protein